MGQCILYLCAVIVEKATITLVVQLDFWEEVRKFILLPVKNHPKIELAIVMLIIPFVFNVSGVFKKIIAYRHMHFVAMKYPTIRKQLAYVLYLTSWLNTSALTNFFSIPDVIICGLCLFKNHIALITDIIFKKISVQRK